MTRISRDEYFLRIAEAAALRGTCDRAQVGCVLVHDGNIISTGFNGSAPGEEHCDDVGHDIQDGHCVRTRHAELNAVRRAFMTTRSIDGATAYITHYPCPSCYQLLKTFDVRRIVVRNMYGTVKHDDVEVLP